MANKPHLTKGEFSKIHELSNLGLKKSLIAKAIGKSQGTIVRVLRHESFDTYFAPRPKKYKKTKTVSTEQEQDLVTIDLVSIITNLNQTLMAMDERLKFIEENVEVNKRRIFR